MGGCWETEYTAVILRNSKEKHYYHLLNLTQKVKAPENSAHKINIIQNVLQGLLSSQLLWELFCQFYQKKKKKNQDLLCVANSEQTFLTSISAMDKEADSGERQPLDWPHRLWARKRVEMARWDTCWLQVSSQNF